VTVTSDIVKWAQQQLSAPGAKKRTMLVYIVDPHEAQRLRLELQIDQAAFVHSLATGTLQVGGARVSLIGLKGAVLKGAS
jgi:hypothetical protein